MTSLRPGRELDGRIAKAFRVEGVQIEDGTFGAVGPMWKYHDGFREEFNPSSDIRAAFALVKAVDSRLFWLEACLDGRWQACFMGRGEGSRGFAPVEDTAELAICSAALLLVREPQEKRGS